MGLKTKYDLEARANRFLSWMDIAFILVSIAVVYFHSSTGSLPGWTRDLAYVAAFLFGCFWVNKELPRKIAAIKGYSVELSAEFPLIVSGDLYEKLSAVPGYKFADPKKVEAAYGKDYEPIATRKGFSGIVILRFKAHSVIEFSPFVGCWITKRDHWSFCAHTVGHDISDGNTHMLGFLLGYGRPTVSTLDKIKEIESSLTEDGWMFRLTHPTAL